MGLSISLNVGRIGEVLAVGYFPDSLFSLVICARIWANAVSRLFAVRCPRQLDRRSERSEEVRGLIYIVKIALTVYMSDNQSIWGEGDKLTLQLLKEISIQGTWLDLAAGDGRYVPQLLERVQKLVVSDYDMNQLQKILQKLSNNQKPKIEVKQFDMNKEFPFNNGIFDGIFCTGTLHLFSEKQLEFIFKEMDRILKTKGYMILDFAVDIIREPTSEEIISKYPGLYKLEEAKELLQNMLQNYSIEMKESTFEDDLTNEPGYRFKAKGKFILLVAKKNGNS